MGEHERRAESYVESSGNQGARGGRQAAGDSTDPRETPDPVD
jgi:hypothetical protein